MNPEYEFMYDENQMLIDSKKDHTITPPEIEDDIDVLDPGEYRDYSYNDEWLRFSDINFFRHLL